MSYFEIGKIVNTKGLKGEVKIIPLTYDVKRFEKLKEVDIFLKGHIKQYTIEKIIYHKLFVILKFKEINNIDDAKCLSGGIIRIDESLALPLESDEYYIRDIYNLNVFTESGEFLGQIVDIIETGANDVYVVKSEKNKDLLIPAIKKCILNIDLKEKVMVVKLLEGLR